MQLLVKYTVADDDEIYPAAISTTQSNAMIVDLIPGNIHQMFLGAEVLPILNTFGCVSKIFITILFYTK
jgi:hypothetical protein